MEVKFLKDFRGKETKEVFYPAGSVAAVKDHYAARLIQLGFAEVFETTMPVKVENEAEIFSPEAGVVVEDAPEVEVQNFVSLSDPVRIAKEKGSSAKKAKK